MTRAAQVCPRLSLFSREGPSCLVWRDSQPNPKGTNEMQRNSDTIALRDHSTLQPQALRSLRVQRRNSKGHTHKYMCTGKILLNTTHFRTHITHKQFRILLSSPSPFFGCSALALSCWMQVGWEGTWRVYPQPSTCQSLAGAPFPHAIFRVNMLLLGLIFLHLFWFPCQIHTY